MADYTNKVTSAYTSILHLSTGDMNVVTFDIDAPSWNDTVHSNVETYLQSTAFSAQLPSVAYYMNEHAFNIEGSSGFSILNCNFQTIENWNLDTAWRNYPYAQYYKPDGAVGGGVFYGTDDDNNSLMYFCLFKFNDGSVYLGEFSASSLSSGQMSFFSLPLSYGNTRPFNPTRFEYGQYGALSTSDYSLHSTISTDPFTPGGESKESASDDGTWDDSGDSIEIPGVPTWSATDAGFVTIYRPSLVQLKNLAGYMWNSDLFDLDTYKKLYANPMDCILGLSVVPVDPGTAGSTPVRVGNLSTGVSMDVAATEHVILNCGSVDINHYSGSALDYEPYTKIQIYLPYIGFRELSTDEVMGGSVEVEYHVDILSGAMMCYLRARGRVIGQYSGSCSAQLPISANDMSAIITGAISIAASVGSMIATKGGSVGAEAANIASTVVSMKPHVQKSGSCSGVAGHLGSRTPYLIIHRPNQCYPYGKSHYVGLPSVIYQKEMGNLSGYTEMQDVFLYNTGATEEENKEIENLLKKGVIF